MALVWTLVYQLLAQQWVLGSVQHTRHILKDRPLSQSVSPKPVPWMSL